MISIVIPVMNEAENISQLIPRIYALPYAVEVLLIDAKYGSADNTEEIIEKFKNQDNYKNLNLIRQQESGFANALIEGLKAAKGDVIITMDAENHLPEEIPLLINKLREKNANVVVGSRFLKGANVALDKKRLIPSKIGNKIAKASLRLNIEDCSSGFRAYKTSTVQSALENMKTQYFSVQVEILDRIKEAGGKLLEVPCTYVARESGKSKYDIKPAFEDSVNILKIAKDRQIGDIKTKTGNIKDKFKDMKLEADKVKSKGEDIFQKKFKIQFKM